MKTRFFFASLSLLLSVVVAHQTRSDAMEQLAADVDVSPVDYAEPKKLCDLANLDIRESSGLAASRLRPGLLWTHNDSGDQARIFAFDLQGRDLGTYGIDGARADDWEDMASFRMGGVSCLLLADVGDNWSRRAQGTLYLVHEPDVQQTSRARLLQTVKFRYENGPHNCEAVGFDPSRREVLLVAKQMALSSSVYVIPWPGTGTTGHVIARAIGTIPIPVVTAMDISPDGRRAVVLTYGDAYEYVRGRDENWEQALATPVRRIVMPGRRQGESICYGNDGQTLYLTSEKLPTPLFEVRARADLPAARVVPKEP